MASMKQSKCQPLNARKRSCAIAMLFGNGQLTIDNLPGRFFSRIFFSERKYRVNVTSREALCYRSAELLDPTCRKREKTERNRNLHTACGREEKCR